MTQEAVKVHETQEAHESPKTQEVQETQKTQRFRKYDLSNSCPMIRTRGAPCGRAIPRSPRSLRVRPFCPACEQRSYARDDEYPKDMGDRQESPRSSRFPTPSKLQSPRC